MSLRRGQGTMPGAVRWVGRVSVWAAALVAGQLTSATASAASLDVRSWLERPGVKLLAVEFYATWCKPCMEAVPRWKALHEKYRSQGLRLIVVATQDPEAGCVNPGWNPDDLVCDDEGTIARALGAADRLPSAYLWSWEGKLLVRRGHVGEVDEAIRHWMDDAPRVFIEMGRVPKKTKTSAGALLGRVQRELGRTGKLRVIETAEERARLARVKRDSVETRYGDAGQCNLGKGLSAHSILRVQVTDRGRQQRLQMGLLSAENACLVASSVVVWDHEQREASVAEGMAELLAALRGDLEMPRPGDAGQNPATSFAGAPGATAPPSDLSSTAALAPPGAAARADLLAQPSPPSRRTWHWYTAGGGLAAGLAAGVLFGLAESAHSDYLGTFDTEGRLDDGQLDRANAFSAGSIAAASAAAVAAGLALYGFVADESE